MFAQLPPTAVTSRKPAPTAAEPLRSNCTRRHLTSCTLEASRPDKSIRSRRTPSRSSPRSSSGNSCDTNSRERSGRAGASGALDIDLPGLLIRLRLLLPRLRQCSGMSPDVRPSGPCTTLLRVCRFDACLENDEVAECPTVYLLGIAAGRAQACE